MEKIYSKIIPGRLLHIIFRKEDVVDGRTDIIEPDQFIQCSALKLCKHTTFRPHKHLWKERKELTIAQESWVVISGEVKCMFYDLNDVMLGEYILRAGDASYTLSGGHNYEIIEDGIIYEFKTGPYLGQEIDKTFI